MTKSSSPSRLDAFFGNPAAAVGMAVVCNVLWGSAFPFIKMGYRLFAIDATDTALYHEIGRASCRERV